MSWISSEVGGGMSAAEGVKVGGEPQAETVIAFIVEVA